METFDLLESVQPEEGWFAITGIRNNLVSQEFAADREEANEIVARLLAKKHDVYFGVAKFRDSKSRTKSNVQALRAFWLDIDCGPDKTKQGKGYETQQDAIAALKNFIRVTRLPDPVIVNSGRGLHVYWPLEESISRVKWEPIAARLKALCLEKGLLVDPAVFEVSRILRVPGTLNYKSDPPTAVSVLRPAEATSFEGFCSLLGTLPPQEKAPFEPRAERQFSAMGQAFADAALSRFTTVMTKGCKQLDSCYEERATLPEPRWVDALSIANACVDRTEGITLVSEGHPDYDPAEADRKAAGMKHPHSCKTFENNNPGGCSGCKWIGKISNPVVLGREFTPSEEKVKEIVNPDNGTTVKTTIPPIPWPFFRKEGGGIFKEGSGPDSIDEQVSRFDFFVTRRMEDPEVGDVAVMEYHTPYDGVRVFSVSNRVSSDRMEMRRILASKGLTGGDKYSSLLLQYVLTAVFELHSTKKAEKMRLQFGWADKHSKFIVGDKEITVEGNFYSPPSTVTTNMADHLVAVGTLDKWKEVFALYGRKGLEPNAFAALTAFGAPLFQFTGQTGAVINLIDSNSGSGKTTALRMCNSVWGHPLRLCMTQEDTLNSKMLKLGVLCNLPAVVDEITNMTAQELSVFNYAITQGRGKDRVKQSSNELRYNSTTWSTMALCSSNASFYEKLELLKSSPDGERMRLFEYHLMKSNAIEVEHAKEMFDFQLMENYGHAGVIYAEFLVKNYEYVRTMVTGLQRKIDHELQLSARERFWSATLAANFVGGLLAKRLGLIDWELEPIFKWAMAQALTNRADVAPVLIDAGHILGDYINAHVQNVLVVNAFEDPKSRKELLPNVLPTRELSIRYEPDTKMLFLAMRPFREYCAKYQINYRETLTTFKASGMFLRADTKRLGAGMKMAAGPVHCLVFDGGHKDFQIDIEQMVPEFPEQPDDAGGG